MTTENTAGLAEAITKIEGMAQEAVPIEKQIITIEVSDQDKTIKVPIAIVPDIGGDAKAIVLLDAIKQSTAFAREQRLLYAAGPDRREGTAKMQSLASLTAHINRFKDGDSAVWADAAGRKLVAVLDYHRAPVKADAGAYAASTGEPRWGKHRSVYECPLSEAWRAWGGGVPLVMDQATFAAFLDAHDRELTSGKLPGDKAAPDPSLLISIAAQLEVFSHATAKRERDANSGRLSISYKEESGVSGGVITPPSFLIRISAFQDAEPMLLEVRLRVDVKDGKAQFTVGIHAAGDVLREAFAMLCQRVEEETKLPLFQGTPEA